MADEELTTQAAAREAIFAAVHKLAEDSENFGGVARSTMLRDAALAYRFAAGGAQPGTVTVSDGK